MDIVELEFFPTDFSTNALVYHLGEKKLYKNIGTETVPVFSEITSGVPIGVIQMFAGLNAQIPAGFLRCNGGAISRATYADLYAAVGTQWGAGDGNLTFNLPDFESDNKFPRASNSDAELGEDGGENLSEIDLPANLVNWRIDSNISNPRGPSTTRGLAGSGSAAFFNTNPPINSRVDSISSLSADTDPRYRNSNVSLRTQDVEVNKDNKPAYASAYFIIKF